MAEAVAALCGAPTGYLVSAAGERGAVNYRIKAAVDEAHVSNAICGVAVTPHTGLADNLEHFPFRRTQLAPLPGRPEHTVVEWPDGGAGRRDST
ncbi:MAG: hypothetical protein V3U93_01140 [Alphaproteobacteria bacterium]